MALNGAPARLTGWYGEARLFSYMDEVQPVFDQYCVACHDYGNIQGDLNLARDLDLTFNTSYNELWRKGVISVPGAGPAAIQAARSWGSHASKLVKILRDGHCGVELDRESMDRIVTWVDINAPYYPGYASAFPANLAGRAPLDNPQLARLGALTGVPFDTLADCRTNLGPQVSFDRPALSPCLLNIEGKDTPEYGEALAIIEAGKATLAVQPRADKAAFSPSPADQQREERYIQRRAIELANRAAIRNNTRAYDEQ